MTDSNTSEETKQVFGERYLRNRPFLIVELSHRPARGVKTHVKGWADSALKIDAFEKVAVVDRVNSKHEIESAFIIDILNRKVIKNRLIDTRSEEEVIDHFFNKYQDEITRGMAAFLKTRGITADIEPVAEVEPTE